jgi:hypothetical protein
LDHIPLTRTVLFVGDYFSLMTTVTLLEEFRLPEEEDNDYAVRLAGEFLKAHYGWDVAAVSNDIGVVDEDAELELED